MILNGKEFKIYDYDTQKTITERIASQLKTIPKYLWYKGVDKKYTEEPNFIEHTPESIIVVNVISDLDNLKDSKLTTFESTYSDWFIQSGNIGNSSEEENKEDLLQWWIIKTIQSDKREGIQEQISILVLSDELKEGVGGRQFDLNLPQKVWSKRDRIKTEYNDLVAKNKALSALNEKRFRDLDKIPKAKEEFTKFIIEKIKIAFIVKGYQTTMLSLFNTIDMNRIDSDGNSVLRIAVVMTSNFFKINRTIDASEFKRFDASQIIENSGLNKGIGAACGVSSMNVVIMNEPKQKREGKQSKRPEFIDVVVKSQNENLLIEFDLSVSIYNSESDRDIMKQFIVDSLFYRYQATSNAIVTQIGVTAESRVKGSYYIFNRYFQKELFLDMVMNDPDFSILYVDERFKVSKQQSRLYTYFVTPKTGIVAFSLLNQVVLTENDPLFKITKQSGKGPRIKIGTQYIKIRISSVEDKSTIPFFQDSLNRLFSLYFRKSDAILKYYNMYMKITPGGLGIEKNDFSQYEDNDEEVVKKPKQVVQGDGKDGLAAMVPDLFLPLYSRKCAKAPRIVSEQEAIDLNSKGFQTIKFPINREGDLEPLIYACDKHKDHPYPGLKVNDLSNKDTFRYLPCCYKTNPEHKRGSPYGHYYKGEALTKDMTDHELYKTPRIVPNKVFGTLPSSISKIFTNSITSMGNEYFRYGTRYGPDSFIDAVSRATGNFSFENSPDERQQYITTLRRQMSSDSYIGLSRQETFDISPDTVKKWLVSDQYFDPKRFVKIVEDFFDVTIFLFERNVGVTTIIPSHSDDDSITTQTEHIGEAIQRYGSGGQIAIPTHSEIGPYILRPIRDRVIFIYIHMGSEVDKITYPQCETIVKYTENSVRKGNAERKGKRGNVKAIFNRNDNEVKVVSDLFEKLILKYAPSQNMSSLYQTIDSSIEGKQNTLNDRNGLTIKEQFVDESGKTRMLYASWVPNVLYTPNPMRDMLNPLQSDEGPFFTIVTEPIHPLYVPIRKKQDERLCIPFGYENKRHLPQNYAHIAPVTEELVNELMNVYNLTYHKASFTDYLCDASDYLKGTINGVRVRIYVSRQGSNDNVRRSTSTLSKYNEARRVARILFEYVLHKFSATSNGNSERDIKMFMDNNCTVENGFKYTLQPFNEVPFFSSFDSVFTNGDNKVVFSSKDLFVRVMFNVAQLVKQKWSKIQEIGRKSVMETYFENVSDFNVSSEGKFFIIHGLDAFILFLSDTKQGELQLNTLEPFDGPKFFSSDDIENGRVFSTLCFSNMQDAIKIQVNDPDIDHSAPGIIYIFDMMNGYEVYEINGVSGVKLVAFKVDDGTYYLTLKALSP